MYRCKHPRILDIRDEHSYQCKFTVNITPMSRSYLGEKNDEERLNSTHLLPINSIRIRCTNQPVCSFSVYGIPYLQYWNTFRQFDKYECIYNACVTDGLDRSCYNQHQTPVCNNMLRCTCRLTGVCNAFTGANVQTNGACHCRDASINSWCQRNMYIPAGRHWIAITLFNKCYEM